MDKIKQFGDNLEVQIKDIEESLKATQGGLQEILIGLVNKQNSGDSNEPTFFEIMADKELQDLKKENDMLKTTIAKQNELLKQLYSEVNSVIKDLKNI
jgi:hypothetical protein